jgi:hypothetical protein
MLYFIGDGTRIKIGISTDPSVRRAALQTGNPKPCRVLLALAIANDGEIEKLLHARLQFCKEQGEWFNIPFSTAFQHLTDIVASLRFPDNPELPLAAPVEPQLSDYADAFEVWLIRTERVLPHQWNRDLYPVWYLWDIFGREFLSEHKGLSTVLRSDAADGKRCT